jgi:NAD(P)H-dependent flavin oxidoreductase YrpB (nitropropane dioxygenase family)
VAFNPVGQIVGEINAVEPTRDVIVRLVEEYVDAVEHLNSLQPEL